MGKRAFGQTIGIDYSGAATPKKIFIGLSAYRADGKMRPQEVYPALWSRRFSRGSMNQHQHDACSVA